VSRALKVLCVAEDPASLAALKRAASSAEWELAPGATDESAAMGQLREEGPHVLVVSGPFASLVAAALRERPALRVVADREMPGVAVVAGSADDVRDAILGRTRPGPVR
jgi:hypothetical protein